MKRMILLVTLFALVFPFIDASMPRIVDLKDHAFDFSIPKSEAFNSSPELGLYLTRLAKDHHIDVAIETGTWKGDTTIFLSDYFAKVFTIEVSIEHFFAAQRYLQRFSNIKCIYGSSEQAFHQILPSLADQPIFFYLDAHWYEQWPLLDELEEISLTHKDNCILVIDDFKVPGRPDIPYDAYGRNECSFDYIEEKLNKVFSEYACFYLIPRNLESRAKFVAYPKSWE